MGADRERIVFLDWLRVVACFMVMAIHSAEPFYLGGDRLAQNPRSRKVELLTRGGLHFFPGYDILHTFTP